MNHWKKRFWERGLARRMGGLAGLWLALLLAAGLVFLAGFKATGAALFLLGTALLLWAGYRGIYTPLAGLERALSSPESEGKGPFSLERGDKGMLSDHPLGRKFLELEERADERYNANILEKQAELSALQSQINPHFLYNTLESIRGKALNQGAAEIADMTEAMATFFRYSISLRENIVTLGEELENARNYFKIQQFRFNNRFRLHIQVDPDWDMGRCRLPKLTLQPIIENAIYHGLEGKMGAGSITVKVMDTRYHTLIVVSDDGLGMAEETLAALRRGIRGESPQRAGDRGGSGIALFNVHRRIQLTYGERYGLTVNSTLGMGTDVEILLPSWKGEEAL